MPKVFITGPSVEDTKKHEKIVRENFNKMLNKAKKEDKNLSFKVLSMIDGHISNDLELEKRAISKYKKLDLNIRLACLTEPGLRNLFQKYLFSSMSKSVFGKKIIRALLLCSFEQKVENILIISSFKASN